MNILIHEDESNGPLIPLSKIKITDLIQTKNICLPTREISFTKHSTGQIYHATLFTLDSSLEITYRARVIIIPNPGETVDLYIRTIKVLLSNGYECFYYQTEMWQRTNLNKNPINNDQISREFNRIVKICVDDLDHNNYYYYYGNSKIHLLGSFIGGSMALDYCINDKIGYFNYRIKSVVCVNPLIDVSGFKTITKTGVLFCKKMISKGNKMMTKCFDIDQLTRYKEFQELALSNELGKVNVGYFQYLLKCFHRISSKSKRLTVHKKAIRNTFIIQSVPNSFSNHQQENHIQKSTERFINRIRPFVNESCDSKIYHFKGTATGVNLFLEREDIFEQTMAGVLSWLNSN